MESSLKKQLNRIEYLMEYVSDEINSSPKKTEINEKIPFRINWVGGNKLKVQSIETGNSIEIPSDLIEEFLMKISQFKKI